MVKYITKSDLSILVNLASRQINEKKEGFFDWQDDPAIEDGEFAVGCKAAAKIYKAKLDGAYAERCAVTVGYIIGAVNAGLKVALLQKVKEPGLPFNAEGWVVVSICGYPIFHWAPWDFPMEAAQKEGLISLVEPNTRDDTVHAWKNTNKPKELTMLLGWIADPSSAPDPEAST